MYSRYQSASRRIWTSSEAASLWQHWTQWASCATTGCCCWQSFYRSCNPGWRRTVARVWDKGCHIRKRKGLRPLATSYAEHCYEQTDKARIRAEETQTDIHNCQMSSITPYKKQSICDLIGTIRECSAGTNTGLSRTGIRYSWRTTSSFYTLLIAPQRLKRRGLERIISWP